MEMEAISPSHSAHPNLTEEGMINHANKIDRDQSSKNSLHEKEINSQMDDKSNISHEMHINPTANSNPISSINHSLNSSLDISSNLIHSTTSGKQYKGSSIPLETFDNEEEDIDKEEATDDKSDEDFFEIDSQTLSNTNPPTDKNSSYHESNKTESFKKPELSSRLSELTPLINESQHDTKLKTSDTPSQVESKQSSTSLTTSSVFTKEQTKYCTVILKSLKRNKDSYPFLQPVDPAALQIPDYFDVIKFPMDLGTIASRLNNNFYATLDAFVSDIRLVFSNCYTYNSPQNPIYTMGKNLEKLFDALLKKIPIDEKMSPNTPRTSDSSDRLRKPSSVKRQHDESFTEINNKKSESNALTSPTPTASRRSSSGSFQRKTNNTGNSDLYAGEDLKYCHTILKDITSKKYSSIVWPFLTPVDPIGLGIPDYFQVIKHPMDFSTIKKKLESKQYSTAEEFENHVRLMFNNCYVYNSPDTEVVKLCRTLEQIFNEKWILRPSKNRSFMDEDDFSDEDARIAEKSQQIQILQNEIKELLAQKSNKKNARHSSAGTPKLSSTPNSNVNKRGRKQKKSSGEFHRPLTFEEKRQLSLDINDLQPEMLGRVLEIIHESMPHLKETAENGEIELDVDTLDLKTLNSLARYVKQCKAMSMENQNSKKKRKSVGSRRPMDSSSTSSDEDELTGSDEDEL